MSTTIAQTFSLYSLLIVYLASGSLGSREFNIRFTDIKCSCDKNYAFNYSCSLQGPAPAASCNFEMQMMKPIRDLRLDINFNLQRNKKKNILFYSAVNLDVCTEFHKNITVPMVQLFKDLTLRSGKWPKCPIPPNYYFKFTNITADLNYLPVFLPEVGFNAVIILRDGRTTFLSVTVFGKIIHTKKLKSKRRN